MSHRALSQTRLHDLGASLSVTESEACRRVVASSSFSRLLLFDSEEEGPSPTTLFCGREWSTSGYFDYRGNLPTSSQDQQVTTSIADSEDLDSTGDKRTSGQPFNLNRALLVRK